MSDRRVIRFRLGIGGWALGIGHWALGIALSLAFLGQAKYTITNQGKGVGKASLTQKLLPNGEKTVQLSLEMSGPGGKTASVRAESRYDANGAPIRQFLESLGTKPPSRRQVTATFDAKGAHVIVDESGARKVQDVALVDTAPRKDPSQFWFIRDKPKPGATATYYRFDADSLSWTLIHVAYMGPKSITVGSSTVKAHLIRDDRADTYVDDSGLPIRITIGSVVFERFGT